MKQLICLIILLPFLSCVSSKNVAETRNAEITSSNQYELYKLWRELDIARFSENIAKVKIALIPENDPKTEPDSTDQIFRIYCYLKNEISRRDSGFTALKEEYFNAPDSDKIVQFAKLKSDKKDKEFLSNLDNNLYFELYENMESKTRNAINESRFYSSQRGFEDYLNSRAFTSATQTEIKNALDDLPLELSEKQYQEFLSKGINFLIRISAKYNLDYSDQAQDHIGSDNINLKLINVQLGEEITTAKIIKYWGDE